MLRHAIAPASFFTQVSNEIIRHPRLSSDAVRLLTWQLSLPPGADQPLSKTAERAGIKRAGFMCAKRELTAEGFLHEWRLQGSTGRWSTTQLLSSVPLSADDAALVRDGCPTGGIPAAGGPGSRSVGRSQKNTEENTPSPPTPPSPPDKQADAEAAAQREEEPPLKPTAVPQAPAPPLPAPLVEQGALALAAISHSERQLRLSGHDIAALAPIAGQWFQRGASMTDLRDALTSGLPPAVRSPAGLTHNRLTRKMPDPSTRPQQCADGHQMAGPSSRLAGTRECQGTHVQTQLFRPVADEVLCQQCRRETTEAEGEPEQVSAAVAAALRGAAAVRASLDSLARATA
ncbi:hypothetical protein [Streptomyces olivoreticuli]|uniref:hypothetical protein n=1 Tax=Streptomyces olivoreticuli TaxID=68246 RepID=UPI0013C35E76|nr:hypothetical protein [Streptomyces olivoreticuli]